MAYVLKNAEGLIIAASANENLGDPWQLVESNSKEYIDFLESELKAHDAFRESDIQLARVLEDLINILIMRNVIQFTDFPSAAQKRLSERQAMRHKNKLSLLDEHEHFPDINLVN